MLTKAKIKLQELRDNIEKYGVSINSTKTEYTVIGNRDIPRGKIQILYIKIKQVNKYNYLRNAITDNSKCDKESKHTMEWQRKTHKSLKK